MEKYSEMSRDQLLALKKELDQQYADIKAQGLALDMSRGKPGTDQLDLSMGMMQVLADELGNISSVRVNCINPGPTNTHMRRSAYPGENPAINPEPQQIMPTYLYLMGPDSAGVNGASFDAQFR